MEEELLRSLIKRYESVSFFVTKRLNALIQGQLPEDITQEQFAIIRYLRSRQESTSTELADVFCVGKSSITSIISRLVDKGVIRRIPDQRDRRVTILSLTEKWQEIAEDTDRIIEETIGPYIRLFSQEKALHFIETFEELADKLKE